MFNIKEFQACFSTYYFTWETYVQCAIALQRMGVERRLFHPKISQRSCNVQHCTCTQKVAMHSMFNIKEFQACFSTFFVCCKEIYFTWEKCVQFALHCRECALKDECFIQRYRSDPPMYNTVPAPKK